MVYGEVGCLVVFEADFVFRHPVFLLFLFTTTSGEGNLAYPTKRATTVSFGVADSSRVRKFSCNTSDHHRRG
jgi:hypothetical protein